MAEIELKKRTMADMVAYFNREVSMMDIPQKYKMQLLGMITAIEHKYDVDMAERAERWVIT